MYYSLVNSAPCPSHFLSLSFCLTLFLPNICCLPSTFNQNFHICYLTRFSVDSPTLFLSMSCLWMTVMASYSKHDVRIPDLPPLWPPHYQYFTDGNRLPVICKLLPMFNSFLPPQYFYPVSSIPPHLQTIPPVCTVPKIRLP